MRDVDGGQAAGLTSAYARRERLLEAFEAAWRRGERPALADYLPGGPIEPELLLDLIQADLEYRLRAGEPARAEDYLTRFPEAAGDPALAVALIAREYQLRRGREPGLRPDEYAARFPQYRAELARCLSPAQGEIPRATAPAAIPSGEPDTLAPQPSAVAGTGANGTSLGLPSPASPSTYPVLPGFEILGELGRGGMGVVYKARQLRLNRVVALKIVLAGEHARPEDLVRFLAEAEAMAQLHHPHVVQIFEIGQHAGLPYFAMEYLEGGSLSHKLQGSPLPAREAARLVEILARAVQGAHDQGIIHRDLKTTNVLLDGAGRPKITDFGLAKHLNSGDGLTQSGAIMGSPSYMAPEQAAGQSKEVGPAADVYALGAILYELLTGRPPFKAATSLETVYQVLHDDPVPPRRLLPKLPRDLQTITLMALRKQAAKRYPTVAALGDDLVRFLEGKPIVARPVGRLERAWKWARRHPTAAALAGLGVVMLLSLLGLGVWFTGKLQVERDRADAARRLAEQQTERTETLLVDSYTSTGLVAAERGDPAQAALWFATAAGLPQHDEHRARANRLRFELGSRSLPQPTRVLIQHAAQGGTPIGRWSGPKGPSPGWVPAEALGDAVAKLLPNLDGIHLLALSASTNHWVLWNVQAEKRVPLPGEEEGVSAATWSADGDLLAVGTTSGHCRLLRLAGLKTEHELPLDGPVTELSFSRDGRWLAVGRDKELRIWDVKRRTFLGEPLELPGRVLWLVFDQRGARLAVASGDHAVRVYKLEAPAQGTSGGAIKLLIGPFVNQLTQYDYFSHVAPVWVDDDRGLLTCASFNEVGWWDADTGKEVRRLRPNLWNVRAIGASPDGLHVAITGWWGCQLYDARSGKEVGRPMRHTDLVTCAAFSPDGWKLLTGSIDQSLRLWSVSTAQPLGPPLRSSHPVEAAGFLGRRMLAAQSDGLLTLWSLPQFTLPFRDHPIPAAIGKPIGLTSFVDPEGRYLLSLTSAGQACVIDLQSGKPSGPTLDLPDTKFVGAFLPQQSVVVIQTCQDVRAWDWRAGRTLWGPKALPSDGYSISASPDGRSLVSMCADRGLLLEACTGKTVAEFVHAGPPDLVNSVPHVRFSPDGRCFATFRAWPTVTIWDTDSARPRFAPCGTAIGWRISLSPRTAATWRPRARTSWRECSMW